MTACIVGWAHTPFGKLAGETVESLIVQVATQALADAGIEPKDVDEIVLGHFNAGFSAQDFTASLVLQASPDLRFKRATRVENACATGSAAVHQGLKAIAARSARIVLVVGVEQMTATPAPEVGRNLCQRIGLIAPALEIKPGDLAKNPGEAAVDVGFFAHVGRLQKVAADFGCRRRRHLLDADDEHDAGRARRD